MRRAQSLTSYTVEVSSAAWRQLSQLPLETYERIRTELDFLAATLREPTPVPLPPGATRPAVARSLLLEGYVAHYDVDLEHRRLTLLGVARRLPQDT